MLQDLRLALRSLRSTPIVTAVAVLSLALGIGANVAFFSIINTLVLRSLPVRDPQALVIVSDSASDVKGWSYPVWNEIRARPALFAGTLAFSTGGRPLLLSVRGVTQSVTVV